VSTFKQVTTKTGDKGKSKLYDGRIDDKSAVVFDTLGTIDELNSWLGLLKAELAQLNEDYIVNSIDDLQKHIYRILSQIATSPDSDQYKKLKLLTTEDVEILEKFEHTMVEKVSLENSFITPGANVISAKADIVRTICRRVERCLVRFNNKDERNDLLICLQFINRLSDYLFVIARYLEKK